MKVNRFLGRKGGTTLRKRKKFRLAPKAERVMIAHQDELERIFHSDLDTLQKMKQAHELFKTTQLRLRELQKWGSVSLDV